MNPPKKTKGRCRPLVAKAREKSELPNQFSERGKALKFAAVYKMLYYVTISCTHMYNLLFLFSSRDALKKDDNPGEASSSSTDDMTTDATPREETAHSSRNRVSFQITDPPRFTSSLINMPSVRTHSETRPHPISSTNLSTFFPSSYLGSASSSSSSNSSNSPRSSFYISDILNHSSVGTRPSTVLHSALTSDTASAEDVASTSTPSSNAINFHVTVTPPRTDAPPSSSGTPRVQVITSPRNSEGTASSSRPNVMFSDSPIVIPDSPGREEPQLPYPFSLRRFEMRRQLRARRRIARRGAVSQQPRDNPSEPSTDDRDVPRPDTSSQAAAAAGSSSSVTFSFFHDRRLVHNIDLVANFGSKESKKSS